jgi:AhpD family alkylhydroperoxidase
MTRQEVYADIEQTLGIVPGFFKLVPDSVLELEWKLFKGVQLLPGPIPNKFRELIGVGIAAITHCHYCIYFHTEIAKLNGATDEEVEDAVHFAKSSAGWSTYINGAQYDLDQFKHEVDTAVAHVRAMNS